MVYQEVSFGNNIFCGPKDSFSRPNHAVTIVGWDDNYQASGWITKGAYICQNSYGTDMFDNGYIYVAYDDRFIEQNLFGVSKATAYDIEKVYEYDPWGSSGVVTSKNLTNATSSEYDISQITAVNIFDRNTSKSELLDRVGISNWSNQKVEIYVTENFKEDGEPYNYTKVKNMTQTLGMGIYVLDLDIPYTLTKSKYAIAVKHVQDNAERIATVAIETNEANKWWENVKGNLGETYFMDTFNPTSTNKLWRLNVGTKGQYANASIKGYIKEADTPDNPDNPDDPDDPVQNDPTDLLTSDLYGFISGKTRRINKVEKETEYSDFMKHITINSKYPEFKNEKITLVDKDKKTKTSGEIKTGDKIIVSNSEYEISVRGDITGDGKRNILDVVRLRRHIVGFSDGILTGAAFYAADVNYNESVNINDLSTLRWLIVE